jgi:hypothetical protein
MNLRRSKWSHRERTALCKDIQLSSFLFNIFDAFLPGSKTSAGHPCPETNSSNIPGSTCRVWFATRGQKPAALSCLQRHRLEVSRWMPIPCGCISRPPWGLLRLPVDCMPWTETFPCIPVRSSCLYRKRMHCSISSLMDDTCALPAPVHRMKHDRCMLGHGYQSTKKAS